MLIAFSILISVAVYIPIVTSDVAHWENVISDYEGRFGEETNGVPTNSDQVCATNYSQEYRHVVYVDPAKRDSITDCDHQHFTTQPSVTCSDFSVALSLHANSTAYVLASGANITHHLKQDTGDSSTFFEGLQKVGFFGNSSDFVARIECHDNAGLAFWNTDQVTMQNVQFSYCGTLRKSTSNDFLKDDFHLVQVNVGLYFYNGSDVTMCYVTVRDGVDALGVLMYDINGRVDVYHSSFENNTISNDYTRPGGGGFGVEFSYCVPGDQGCNLTKNQGTHNADSKYTFYMTSFVGNAARAAGANRLLTSSRIHEGLGRGGGMAVYFKGNASRNDFQIIRCKFKDNQALWGGGLMLEFDDTSLANTVIIDGTIFFNNSCYNKSGIAGGGIRILSLLYFEPGPVFDDSVRGNKVTISGYFLSNKAKSGCSYLVLTCISGKIPTARNNYGQNY